jgi:hypothetical protein
METSLVFATEAKQLSMRFNQRVRSDFGLELRGWGLLNTGSGAFAYKASLLKTLELGAVSAKAGAAGTTPLTLAAGVTLSSASREEPVLCASARKTIALLEGDSTLLTAKALAEYEPSSKRLARRASLRLSRKFLNLTERQDIKITGGVDVDLTKPSPAPVPYLRVRENNVGVAYKGRRWMVTYDL